MRKIIAVCSLTVAVFVSGHAQSVKEFLKKGETQYKQKQYDAALKTYQDGLKLHPNDAKLNFRAGLTYLSLPNKAESLRFLQKAFTISHNIDENIYYYLGLSYQSNKQYQKAQEFFNEHKKLHKDQANDVDKRIKQTIFADSVTRSPTTAIVENVGKAINSSFHEYSPLVSGDGNTMIFTSNRPEPGITPPKGVPLFEDIYISKRVKGKWSMPEKISPNINIRFNDAAASVSPDGKTLVLYYEYGGGDIYISKLQGNEWSKPLPLNQNINTPAFWETSAFVSSDGRQLYFTSNRPGGLGNLDIYVSEMEMTGDWGHAENLGPVINTSGREDSPALDPAGKTLYFSSDGHAGMGGTDIFKSELKDGKWQKPVNLGYPTNSVEDDSFFSISADNRKAFFSTMREEGNAEIYTLTFIEPSPAIAGVVPPDNTERKIVIPSNAIEVAPNKPTRQTKSSGPAPSVEKPKANTSVPAKRNEPVKKSPTPYKTASKKLLFFGINSDDLNRESVRKLEDISGTLKNNGSTRSVIEGHTDNTGSDILNNALSIRRANAVAKYFVRKGINPSRLSVKGYGAKRPLVSNDDEKDGREINRRIEIGFLK